MVLGRYSVEEVIKAGVFGKASLQRRTATPPGSRMQWLSGGADGAQAAGQRLPASCQLLPGLLAATYLHTALTGCVVSRRPAFLLQQPPPFPLSSLFSSHSVSFPHKYAQKQHFFCRKLANTCLTRELVLLSITVFVNSTHIETAMLSDHTVPGPS